MHNLVIIFFSYYITYFPRSQIADKSPLPLIINNTPSHTFIDYPAELCIDLANHPNIVALKESSHNVRAQSLPSLNQTYS